MATQRLRADSNATASPHTLSLKVLRLTRPTFATQTPLPASHFGNGLDIDQKASLAYPSATPSTFPLSPVLTLPKAFGVAYVGQKFECTLCVNNESSTSVVEQKIVNKIKITADLQTPTAQTGIPLGLNCAASSASEDGYELQPGRTLQLNLARELQEAGQHVLVVTVAYSETTTSTSASELQQARNRTFRKLYQFAAQQLISIRSKVTERRTSGQVRQWIIEAQIENMGENDVILSSISLKADDGVTADQVTNSVMNGTVSLKPQDIQQVMFLVNQKDVEQVVRRRLGQIHVLWNAAMGEKGTVKTGWLLSKT